MSLHLLQCPYPPLGVWDITLVREKKSTETGEHLETLVTLRWHTGVIKVHVNTLACEAYHVKQCELKRLIEECKTLMRDKRSHCICDLKCPNEQLRIRPLALSHTKGCVFCGKTKTRTWAEIVKQ